MSIMPIYIAPHSVLKKVAEPIEAVNDELKKLMDDMLETMYNAPGIGLAAPQVGVSKRLLVLDVEQPRGPDDEDLPLEKRRGKPICFVNPEVLWSSDEPNVYDEGCLSLPGQFAEIERPKKVRVKFVNYEGKQEEIEADGLLATCLQHEIDHLDGVLFVDHLSQIKRNMIMRRLKKWTKENAEDLADTHIL
ncbi:MAG: peptide deformylase [Alphaproteobacteria bacterium]|nr:peptide deformylase [Alphaproteobacteria bacterium]